MTNPTDKSCVLLCARCAEDVGIKLEELENAVMLPKPLSLEEIEKLREYHGINDWLYETSVIDFVRAIEKEHGIK